MLYYRTYAYAVLFKQPDVYSDKDHGDTKATSKKNKYHKINTWIDNVLVGVEVFREVGSESDSSGVPESFPGSAHISEA